MKFESIMVTGNGYRRPHFMYTISLNMKYPEYTYLLWQKVNEWWLRALGTQELRMIIDG